MAAIWGQTGCPGSSAKCLGSGTGPLDSGRAATFWVFISFLPLWEQLGRKGLPLSSQEGGRGPTFSRVVGWLGREAACWPVTWSFLQHLAVETDGRLIVLFSEHQVSQHLTEDAGAVCS